MLLNVAHDRHFQSYLDTMEQKLHVRMVPVLSAGMRLQMSRGGIIAAHYIIQRGEPILLSHYRHVYEDVFTSTVDQIEKAARTGKSAFMQAQLSYLEREAAKRISDISQRSVNKVRDIVMDGVRKGKSNDQIARALYKAIPKLSRDHAATIARTETHSAAMAATDETLQYKKIKVKSKTWWSKQDSKVRKSHAEAHGVRIPYDQPFEVGGSLMMYPSDESLGASADQIVNCRCSLLYNTTF